jgi:hypothetical protein
VISTHDLKSHIGTDGKDFSDFDIGDLNGKTFVLESVDQLVHFRVDRKLQPDLLA